MIINLEYNYLVNYCSGNDDDKDPKPLPDPDPEDDDTIFKRKDKKRNT
jgi:hypothetical protein